MRDPTSRNDFFDLAMGLTFSSHVCCSFWSLLSSRVLQLSYLIWLGPLFSNVSGRVTGRNECCWVTLISMSMSTVNDTRFFFFFFLKKKKYLKILSTSIYIFDKKVRLKKKKFEGQRIIQTTKDTLIIQ
jgi:hypothetical protein